MRCWKMNTVSVITAVLALAMLCAAASSFAQATLVVVNNDGPGEGFNDPAPFTPIGGNNATTLGQARLNAFQAAADIWGACLTSGVTILVESNFDPLSCNATSAVLGSAGPKTVHRDFTNAPLANTYYPAALANALAGSDLDPTQADIRARFNSDIDNNNSCLRGINWYYGLDGNPTGDPVNGVDDDGDGVIDEGFDIDLVTVLLHEFCHGLGFASLVDNATGAKFNGRDDTFMRYLEYHGFGTWPGLTDAQRAAAAIADPNLHWVGANVLNIAAMIPLTGGFPGGHVQMHAPHTLAPGSSVSHFSTAVTPNELMEPSYTGPDHTVGLALPLMGDIGWTIDSTPPDLECPDDVTVECSDFCGTPWDDPQLAAFFAGVSASDDCCDPTVTNDAPACFPLGTTTVTFTATDCAGNSSSCSADVTVEDTTPPEITIRLSRRVLWPPNHKMAFVRARVEVTDVCCGNPTFTLLGVTSNEPVNGKGDGNTAPDWVVLSPTRFLLRSERAGGGDGRVYTIRYRADDCSGNSTYARARVRVPHDHSGFAFASAGFTSGGIGFDLNLDRFALVIRSTEEEWVTDENGNTYQVSEPFDATTVDLSQAYVGNINGAVLPEEVRQIDNNADGLMDVVLYYPAQDVNQLIDGSTPTYEDEINLDNQPGPIGLHYTDTAGVDYLVPNIFNLGEPVPIVPPIEIGRGRAPDSPEIPETKVTELMPSYPNPFNPSTTIPFNLQSEEHVVLRIYNARGELVRTLRNDNMPAGLHEVVWDGLDNNGGRVATGVYFVALRAGTYQATKKVVMIK